MTDTLEQNYEKAGYHAQQSWGTRPALVLVDFAQAYFDPEAPLFGGEGCAAARDHAITLAEAARAVGVPVIFTEVKYQPGGGDGGAFYAKVPALSCFDAGRDTQRLVDGLRVEPGDLMITKQYPSAFFGTSLAATLQFHQIDTLIIGGLTTSGCVRATCIDSISSGFVTLIAHQACGDRATGPHEANLFDMSAKYADLVGTDDAVAYMKSCAAT
ncbi:isochorismatase family protein [Sedimentitalea arenosa]|uniref:Isochorismatase family protein n=1 Tax=Sedimentitalea arenosa TaxID=2798803 RepID=A0A8J7IZL3_9RHOB|nr:isochorismatase family protein [Arenibacterium arenosum]MBJ6370360.1 isochorismatase family protein [Arenibacterium arenosum]